MQKKLTKKYYLRVEHYFDQLLDGTERFMYDYKWINSYTKFQ